ncbi:MAG: hypothetical protein JWO72_326 [Caulobacteraceae bacterium]|nr:hypothetical protein [Caulobacteraceae bacterium]
MRTYLQGAAIAALAYAIAQPACAADAAGTAPGAPLEEVIVTATKTETNVQKTAIAMSVVNAPRPPTGPRWATTATSTRPAPSVWKRR